MGIILIFLGGFYVASCVKSVAGDEAAKAALMSLVIIGVLIEYAAYRIIKAIENKKAEPIKPSPSGAPRTMKDQSVDNDPSEGRGMA